MRRKAQAKKAGFVIAALSFGLIAAHSPVRAAGDFFDLRLDDAADRVLRAVGCVLPDPIGTLIQCSNHIGSGIPETTSIKVWGRQAAGQTTDLHGKPSKGRQPFVFMSWQDSSGTPFLPPHAERREAEEMLRQMLLTVGVLNDGPVVKAFFAKVGADEDKVTPIRADGLKVIVEVENQPTRTGRGIFVGPPKFELPD